MSETKFKFPTEVVELPSKGLVYPEDNPLSSGQIEMKYMTAKEEDILSNQNYIEKGTVIDKLLQSLIVSKIDYKDLVVGDKNAIVIAARILGYGKEYKFTVKGEECTVDLSTLENKELDESLYTKGVNEFPYTLPHSKNQITFKLLTHRDDLAIENELRGLKKISKNNSPELSTRLKHLITSVNGDTDVATIREYVDNYLLAMDSRQLRNYVKSMQPDINMETTITDSEGAEFTMEIPFTLNFFWPDVEL
tara:strand:+ start:64 stop:813 length:750 start_codon:yes stop_codon:yes gene_type:complete